MKRGELLDANWTLSLLLGEESTLLPTLTLCGERGSAEMAAMNVTPVDHLLSYQLRSTQIGTLRKLRVGVDAERILEVLSPNASKNGSEVEEDYGDVFVALSNRRGPMTFVKKVRGTDR